MQYWVVSLQQQARVVCARLEAEGCFASYPCPWHLQVVAPHQVGCVVRKRQEQEAVVSQVQEIEAAPREMVAMAMVIVAETLGRETRSESHPKS